jgi:tryptophan-rich sensory protein
VLWVYVILAVVMLGVVYWLYQQHKADTGFPVGEDSDAPTWFTPLVFSLLLVISVVAVAYGTFRAYTASQKDSQRNAINVAFGAQVALTMLWAYCFLSEQNQTHALYVAVALLAVTAWQAYYTYSITPMAAYVQAPLLISGAIFAYVNYKVANAA